MKAIILADGSSKRWNNYLGKPKHFITFFGQTLLERTVSLLQDNGIKDIYITTHNKEYAVPGAKLYAPKNNVLEIDKMYSCRKLWEKDGGLLLWGDTFFTKAAMKTIVRTKVKDFVFFGRPYPSKLIEGGYSELFALKIANGKKVLKGLEFLRPRIEKKDKKYADSSFMLFNRLKKDMVLIDDETYDFDYPIDYDRFSSYVDTHRRFVG